MSLLIQKLTNVSEKLDGKITARCPACAAEGGDKKGEHLVVFPDGKFGCVKYENDPAHRNKIHSLAGDGKRMAHIPVKLLVKPYVIPKSAILMNLAAYPKFSGGLKRSCFQKQDIPIELEKSEASDVLQMEFPFMVNVPKRAISSTNERAFEDASECTGWVKSNFANIPARRVFVSHPALPRNPMADRVQVPC